MGFSLEGVVLVAVGDPGVFVASVWVGVGGEVRVTVGLGEADGEGLAVGDTVGVVDWVGLGRGVMVGKGVKVGYGEAVFNGVVVMTRVMVAVGVFEPAAFCAVRAAYNPAQ